MPTFPGRSRLSGTSPRILDPPKSVGSRKRKSPSRRKRNRQRQAAWRLKKKASYIKLQAAAKRQVEKSPIWKPHGHDTGSVIIDTDTPSSPEPASSGPVLTQALEKPEGVSQEPAATVEQSPETYHLQESFSTVVTDSDLSTPDSSIVTESCNNCDVDAANISDIFRIPISDVTFRKCSACKAVSYCSLGCLNNDWPRHKRVCAYVKNSGPLT